MGNPKGSIFERQLMVYLRENGFDAERLRLTGKEDEGDILVRANTNPLGWTPQERRLVIEAKNVSRMNLAGWLEEAEVEAGHYVAHRSGIKAEQVHHAVVHKRKGKGVAKSYVTLPLDEFLRLL